MRINQVCQGKPGVMAGCASHMMSQWPLGRNNEGMQWSRPLPVCAELRNLHNFFNVNPWLLKDCDSSEQLPETETQTHHRRRGVGQRCCLTDDHGTVCALSSVETTA